VLACEDLLYYILERFYKYEWDESKNTKNIGKHRGLSLRDGIEVFLDKARIIFEDEKIQLWRKALYSDR